MAGPPEDYEKQNPDYYTETASLDPRPPPPQYQEYPHEYPPPPGPPPPSLGPSSGPVGGGSTTAYEHPPPKPPRPGQQQQQQQPEHAGLEQAGGGGKVSMRERLFQWSTRVGVPVNKLTNKLGSEAWWPSTLDNECDKAARILQSFTNGFYTTDNTSSSSSPTTSSSGPRKKPKVLVKIPQKAIESAAGLAIFTTFRTGLHISGAGGSGVLVARLPPATPTARPASSSPYASSWSPPSGFLVHTLGAGLMVGLDIYDCVCVLRTPEAVAAFTRPRLSLGGEVGLVAGPVGAGAAVDAALLRNTKPVWGYVKSRGFYAGVQADGTIIVARPDANAAFYGVKGIRVEDILRGSVPAEGPQGMWPEGARRLMEVLKCAEGSRDVNEGLLREVGAGPTPGDLGLGEDGAYKTAEGDHEEKGERASRDGKSPST